MDNGLERSNNISIINLKVFTMCGVIDIAGFVGDYVLLETELGRITVEGKELKIESLTKERGDICITGQISGVYATPIKVKKQGLFSKFIS